MPAKKKAAKSKAKKREQLPAPPSRPYLAPTSVAHEDDLTEDQVEAHRSSFGSQDIAGGAPGDDPRGPTDHATNLRKGIERGDLAGEQHEEVADQLEEEREEAEEHTKEVEESGSQD